MNRPVPGWAALCLLIGAHAAAEPPPGLPVYPGIIRTDKPAYSGRDHITVSLHNPSDAEVWVQPLLEVERSNGDGTWAPVYALWAVEQCRRALPEEIRECVRIPAGADLTLAAWDWNTGGYHQCPPRRPGHRAFKGVHRITARWCEGKAPAGAAPRAKLVTWE